MSELMLVSLVTVIDKTKVGSAASNGDPIRYQYSKIGFMSMKFVIVDVLPDGYKEWWEQRVRRSCLRCFTIEVWRSERHFTALLPAGNMKAGRC